MKKTDLSKTIGLIRRGGLFSASNDLSQQKINAVMKNYPGYYKLEPTMTIGAFYFLQRCAKEQGFKIAVIERGLGR